MSQTNMVSAGLSDTAMGQLQAGQTANAAAKLHAVGQTDLPANDDQARRVAADFESVFLSQMLQHMSADIKTDGPFGGGPGEDMFRSLLNGEYANAMSARGGIGIADNIYRQILALQEV